MSDAPITLRSGSPAPCPMANVRPRQQHGVARPCHTCPYRGEIDDDRTTLCVCCVECEHECADDI